MSTVNTQNEMKQNIHTTCVVLEILGLIIFGLNFYLFHCFFLYSHPIHQSFCKACTAQAITIRSIHKIQFIAVSIFEMFILFSSVAPLITPFSSDENVNVGDTLGLFCQVSKGDPPIFIKWSYRDFNDSRGINTIQISTKRISGKASLLSITNASAPHSGTYTCTATNNAGSTSYSANITVNGKQTKNRT